MRQDSTLNGLCERGMKQQLGTSLIELVVFIAVISIAVTGVTLLFSTLLYQSSINTQMSEALSLAQGRMEIILGQRYFLGYASLSDPCTLGSPPAVCTQTITGYTVTSTITPATINTDANYSTILVTVTGTGNTKVTLKSLVARS